MWLIAHDVQRGPLPTNSHDIYIVTLLEVSWKRAKMARFWGCDADDTSDLATCVGITLAAKRGKRKDGAKTATPEFRGRERFPYHTSCLTKLGRRRLDWFTLSYDDELHLSAFHLFPSPHHNHRISSSWQFESVSATTQVRWPAILQSVRASAARAPTISSMPQSSTLFSATSKTLYQTPQSSLPHLLSDVLALEACTTSCCSTLYSKTRIRRNIDPNH